MVRIINTATLTREVLERMSQNDKDMIYNGLDCCVTHEIDTVTDEVLDDVSQAVYRRSLALQAPILEMNMRGILVDPIAKNKAISSLDKDSIHLQHLLSKLMRALYNEDINPASPKQVAALFYDKLQLPSRKKRNAKGDYVVSTDRDTIEALANAYYIARPFVTLILGIRDVDKQISTLNTPLANGRFTNSLSIAGTKTGRLASSFSDFSVGKNLQNIDKRIKRIFIADPGYKFLNCDLEQADARNVGAQTWQLFPEFGDTNRFLDFAESGDLHTAVCRMCWSELPWTDNPKENRAIADQKAYREKSYRDLAKILGHGTNFNGQPVAMAMHTKVAAHFITDFQRRYFSAFPEVERRIEWVDQQIRKYGYLTTLFGRRRYFLGRPNEKSTLNAACAFDPQSMTADEINNVMLRVYTIVKRRFPELQLLIQVHDSLLMQYPEHLEEEIIPYVREAFRVEIELRGGRKFYVPSEIQVGWNWDYRVDWSEKDYEKGKCDKSLIGTCKDNPDGMIKYRGKDNRVREYRFDAAA